MTFCLYILHVGIVAEAKIKVAVGRGFLAEANVTGVKPIVTASRNNFFLRPAGPGMGGGVGKPFNLPGFKKR